MKKRIAPNKSPRPKTIKHCHDNSTAAQRQRLLKALREAPVTTQDARNELDILHPAGRIKELRRAGLDIVTLWETVETQPGAKHRIGLYVLQAGGTQQGGSHHGS